MTSTANSRPRPPSVARPWIESSTNGAWSNTTAVLTPRSVSVSATSGSGERLLDRVRHLDGVGLRRLRDGQAEGRRAVEAGVRRRFDRLEPHRRHVAHERWTVRHDGRGRVGRLRRQGAGRGSGVRLRGAGARTGARGCGSARDDGELLELVDHVDRLAELHGPGAAALRDLPCGHDHAVVLQHGRQVLRREARRRELLRVGLDLDLGLASARSPRPSGRRRRPPGPARPRSRRCPRGRWGSCPPRRPSGPRARRRRSRS